MIGQRPSVRGLRLSLAGGVLVLAGACSGGGEVPVLAPSPTEAPAQPAASPASDQGDLVIPKPRIEDGRIVIPSPVSAPSLPSELPPLPTQ